MKQGDAVKVVHPVITGTVVKVRWHEGDEQLEALVQTGDGSQSWYPVSQLEKTGDAQ